MHSVYEKKDNFTIIVNFLHKYAHLWRWRLDSNKPTGLLIDLSKAGYDFVDLYQATDVIDRNKNSDR